MVQELLHLSRVHQNLYVTTSLPKSTQVVIGSNSLGKNQAGNQVHNPFHRLYQTISSPIEASSSRSNHVSFRTILNKQAYGHLDQKLPVLEYRYLPVRSLVTSLESRLLELRRKHCCCCSLFSIVREGLRNSTSHYCSFLSVY